MNSNTKTKQLVRRVCRYAFFSLAGAATLVFTGLLCLPVSAQDHRVIGPQRGHVKEMADYVERVEIYAPIRYQHLAVFPVRLREGATLRGSWLTMDQALSRGVLLVREKGTGTVPVVLVENRSRDDMVFIMSGELLAGGKQTRTVRQDVVLSPGQRVELNVFCVEQRRWEGDLSFKSSGAVLPQSIQQALRKGADQQMIWSEVARNNRALGVETSTDSLDHALKSEKVGNSLAEVRRRILPEVPADSVGFIFVSGHRALGAEFFGRPDLAKALLPKLLDSYSVDCILRHKDRVLTDEKTQESVALAFFNRLRNAGSFRVETPGSGAGIQTRSQGILGNGVGLSDVLVHYGAQIQERIIPMPRPKIRPR
jgi:hypothetical protein